jgi:hypothetical protein
MSLTVPNLNSDVTSGGMEAVANGKPGLPAGRGDRSWALRTAFRLKVKQQTDFMAGPVFAD